MKKEKAIQQNIEKCISESNILGRQVDAVSSSFIFTIGLENIVMVKLKKEIVIKL